MARKGENIYKRKDGRWEGRYKTGFDNDGKSKYRSVYGKTYAEVKAVLVRKKSENAKGISVCVSTIKELSLLWLNAVQRTNKESTTAVYITKIQKYILPKLGGIRFDVLSVDIVNDFINGLISLKLSEKYISDIACVLKSILKYAVKVYGCADKSCFVTTYHKQSEKDKILLSPDEEQKLYKSLCKSPTASNSAILLAMTTGMRIGEICALKWSDIDLEKRIITVNHTVQRIRTFKEKLKTKVIETSPKSIKSKREIPIPDIIYTLLKALKCSSDNYFISSSSQITEPQHE